MAKNAMIGMQLPATVGYPGTHMTLGYHDRAVLKGPFLVLRQYRRGKSVLLGGGGGGTSRSSLM
jgi:hypothetical protein